jgi:ribosomal-protein-serine acetyltransferase
VRTLTFMMQVMAKNHATPEQCVMSKPMQKQYLPMKLESERLLLEAHQEENAQVMYEAVNADRTRLRKFLPWPDLINNIEDEIDFIRKCQVAWKEYRSASYAIFRRTDHAFAGVVEAFGLDWNNESFEVGYWISGEYEGQGYVREAVNTLVGQLKAVGFNRAVIMCEPENRRSSSIPLSLGFELEGLLRDYRKENGLYLSLNVYSKLLQR